ncbi:MAG: NUDIX domain-containing protein [Chlamydiales bacterium]
MKKYHTLFGKHRITASVNAFLILHDQDKILLMLRQNTGFLDGHWGLLSGHVEFGESATQGIIREAQEELGIEISLNALRVVHVMHRKTNRINIDIFFDAIDWKGEISNQEPIKCKEIGFFSIPSFPKNTIDYNIAALKFIALGQFYSEWGF